CQYCKVTLEHNWRPTQLLQELAKTLPQDISIQELFYVDPRFKVALSAYEKEYHYYFTSGDNQAAASIKEHATYFVEQLNEEKMQEADNLISGRHSFHNYQ